MEVKAPRRVLNRSALNQAGGYSSSAVCSYWMAGRCNRNPCRFLHQSPTQSHPNTSEKKFAKPPPVLPNQGSHVWKREPLRKNSDVHPNASSVLKEKPSLKPQPRVCAYWFKGNCVHGDKCKDLHSWSYGEGFSLMAKLQGHRKAVTGVALPSGSDKLYSGSKDGTVRVWDCHTGQCAHVFDLGGEIGSLISEGPWLFVGMPNTVKAWNILTSAELSLGGPVGQVYAMVVGNDFLLAGAQDGTILAWRCDSAANSFEPAALLKGHSGAVVSVAAGACNRLYSGSMDHTIRVWDLEALRCIYTLTGHSSVVMSLICWDQYLLSSSLDKTIKVWATAEGGNLEVIYTQNEEHGVLALSGMHDADVKPILLSSSNDNSVSLYELPSFTRRGRLFTKQEVRTIQIGTGGLCFTGDGTGQVTVWTWLAKPNVTTGVQ